MDSRHFAPLFAALFVGGCAASTPPVDVTRFYGAGVPRAESVAIVPGAGRDGGGIEYRTYSNAVAAALARNGFSVVDSGKGSALTAAVDFDTLIDRPVDRRGSPVSVGVGGSTGSYGGGVGVGVGINLSGPPKAIVTSRLSVRLSRGDQAVWEGRAETRAKEGTPGAQPSLAAGKLADALFRDYPGQSGATIRVK